METAYRGFLSVIGDGGYPYTVPINFVYAEGVLYFHCAVEGHKLDAIRASDKACFTVIGTPEKEPGDWWYNVRRRLMRPLPSLNGWMRQYSGTLLPPVRQ